jgi:hypothetical protein
VQAVPFGHGVSSSHARHWPTLHNPVWQSALVAHGWPAPHSWQSQQGREVSLQSGERHLPSSPHTSEVQSLSFSHGPLTHDGHSFFGSPQSTPISPSSTRPLAQ